MWHNVVWIGGIWLVATIIARLIAARSEGKPTLKPAQRAASRSLIGAPQLKHGSWRRLGQTVQNVLPFTPRMNHRGIVARSGRPRVGLTVSQLTRDTRLHARYYHHKTNPRPRLSHCRPLCASASFIAGYNFE
jgi:hypothetical protein